MKKAACSSFVVGLLCFVAVSQEKHADDKAHHVVKPLMRDGKPIVRGTNKYEVVSGDPTVAGAPFVIRIHNYDNQVLPPHWHEIDEHIVVVKGTWLIATGDKWNRSALQELNVGDYVFFPKTMRHFGISKGETVVQIHGIGPFKTILADPWVYLGGADSASSFKFKEGDRVRTPSGEGKVVWGVHSAKNAITQYAVERQNGEVRFEFEADVTKLP